jgi:hypothetical protein
MARNLDIGANPARLYPRLPPDREAEVSRLLSQCVPSAQIREYLSAKWKCKPDQVQKAINEVYFRWSKLPAQDRESRREQMREAFFAFYQRAMKAGSHGPAVTAMDRLCKLDGLYQPDRIEVAEGVGQSLPESDPSKIRQRIVDLYRKRFGDAHAAADAAGPQPTGGHVAPATGDSGEGTATGRPDALPDSGGAN